MTKFEWFEGPLEAETDRIEFHAVDPSAFIAELWLHDGEWTLDITLRKGPHEYVPLRERVVISAPEAVDQIVWADRVLSRLLKDGACATKRVR
jgi:hypothetical protein